MSSDDTRSSMLAGSSPSTASELATMPGEGFDLERESIEPESSLPERFGRFAVLGILGRGGMSTVLEARDEALDREVALKILHRGRGARQGQRLVREAQALARLSHPNVVQVYEVGELDGETFIAMERVRGQTLQKWQARRPPWRECVEVYIQAGRGLAAAHAVGLVHRDFKPSNCVVDDQGQVHVLDFGLALERVARPNEDEPAAGRPVQGTLPYMPLEQLDGGPVDERSDQFSLCVSLYEAIYGERPFDSSSIGRLTMALMKSEVRPAPPGAAVPARLRRIVLRGLATDPGDRWPSVDALLEQLSQLVAPRRARWVVLVLAGGLAALGGGLWQQAQVEERCQGSLDLLTGVWDDARRQEVEAALLATSVPYAADTWSRVGQRLDAYAEAWASSHRDICEATRVRGEQTEDVMSLRMGCSSTRRIALREAVEVLAHADAEVVERAVAIVSELPGLGACDDVEALQTAVPLPDDPAAADHVRALREQLGGVVTLTIASRLDDALASIDAMAQEVEALGYAPLRAELALRRGDVLLGLGRYADAKQALVNAYSVAVEHGHEPVEVEAAERLVDVSGRQAHFAEEQQWGITAMALARKTSPVAEARTLELLGRMLLAQGEYEEALEQLQRVLAIRERNLEPDDPAISQVLDDLGTVARARGRYEEALDHHQRALAIDERAFGADHPALATSLDHLAAVAGQQGRYEEALVYARRGLDIRVHAFGPNHPSVATTLGTVGMVLSRQEEYDQALEAYERALAISVDTLGPTHPSTAGLRINMAAVFVRQRRNAEALDQFRQAYEVLVETLGPDHPDVATVLDNMGGALQGEGRYEEALDHHLRALASRERGLGEEHPLLGYSLGNVGRALMKQGRAEEALEYQRRALAVFERTEGPDHPNVVSALVQMAQSELALGHPERGRPLAERALTIVDRAETGVTMQADVRFVLAQCSWSERGERARALALAEEARERYGSSTAPSPARLADVEAWLDSHR